MTTGEDSLTQNEKEELGRIWSAFAKFKALCLQGSEEERNQAYESYQDILRTASDKVVDLFTKELEGRS